MRRKIYIKNIMVRLSEADYDAFLRHSAKCGLQPAVLARRIMLNVALDNQIETVNPAEFRAMLTELGRQGNNVNQIAHRLNSNSLTQLTPKEIQDLTDSYRKLLVAAVALGRRRS